MRLIKNNFTCVKILEQNESNIIKYEKRTSRTKAYQCRRSIIDNHFAIQKWIRKFNEIYNEQK